MAKKELDEYKVISVPTTLHEMKQHEREHKAIQIAKTKRVDMAHLQDSKDCGEYNEVIKKLATLWRVLPLTEEEYQLLKEIVK